jgi:stress-induced morphogen
MVSPEEIRRRIEEALPDARVTVSDSTGAGDHFEVRVASGAFAGRSLVEQHQLVYRALGPLMARIHALAIQTETPQEARG